MILRDYDNWLVAIALALCAGIVLSLVLQSISMLLATTALLALACAWLAVKMSLDLSTELRARDERLGVMASSLVEGEDRHSALESILNEHEKRLNEHENRMDALAKRVTEDWFRDRVMVHDEESYGRQH